MSRATDAVRAADREASKLDRLQRVLDDLAKVTRLRREGLPMDTIAARMGWAPRTLDGWWRVAQLIARRGIRMSKSSTHP